MEMAQSSEVETSGGVSLENDYDVFLSFRGPDTRQGFTDCLYNHLLEASIRVFRDEEELHVGKEIADELPVAIEKSKIYVPIFSKGYASSGWCLRELTQMVECRESKPSEKEIMPIFYDVETDVVKLKSKLYIKALKQHKKKFNHDVRLKWENALKTVAQIKGWELKKQGYWEFIKLVTREIAMKLKTKDIFITKHLVGMDDRVEAVVKLLDVDSKGVPFMIIHGMGGIGKTTLAKNVFNKLHSHFSHSCFLGNVRESSGGLFGLVDLQKKLLSETLDSAVPENINDVDDGIKVIVRRLSKRKIFIILDDVDDEEQLKKLAIKDISFGSGSRVIITSRNMNILKADETLKYEAEALDDVQSLKLFARHAFGRDHHPPEDFIKLSRQVVSTTGGLPLALEVIGSLLHLQNKAFWVDALDKLREIPHEKVQDKLKISYNALSLAQRQIFLDIACLFVDKDKTNAFYMWKDCRYFPDFSIQVLVYMSLIKITYDNKFWMHDQLKDLGRNIVHGDMESMDPSKHSRLWVPEMANSIIRSKERKEAVEAICLNGFRIISSSATTEQFSSEEFSRFPKLRFLRLYDGQLYGDFQNQLSELRYMSWHKCPKELSATNFHPSNLVVLNLSHSYMDEDWAGWSQIKVAKKLQVLDLTYCPNMTKTPDFSDYTSLKRLILKACGRLIKVDASIEKLKCLVHFDVSRCSRLKELPEEIGGLEKLQYLNLGDCENLRKLPESLGRMTSLVELDLLNTAITKLPEEIGGLEKLQYLNLRDCKKLRKLPESLGRVASLLVLYLSNTAITKLPNSIGNLKHLLVLELNNSEINELPSSIGKLRKLEYLFLSKTEIKELPESIGKMESLLELNVSFTECLQLPESIGDLSRLKVINIMYSPIMNLPQSIVELKELEDLQASFCPHLKWEIPEGIWKLSHLRFLLLDHTPITNVPVTFKQLPRLEELRLDGCSKLELLPELPASLISITFGSSSLRWVSNLSNQTLLKTLRYTGHDEKRCPLFFQDGACRESDGFLPPSMSTLDIRNNKISASFSFRGNFRNLIELGMSECSWKEVQLDGLEQLVKLCVSHLKLLEGFAVLSGLKRLKQLTLDCCPNLTTIQGLGSVESLISLGIQECRKIESLEVSGLKKLEYLRLEKCEELVTVEGLGELESLKNFPNAINSKIPDACRLFVVRCPNFEGDGGDTQFDASVGEYRSRYKQRFQEFSASPKFLL